MDGQFRFGAIGAAAHRSADVAGQLSTLSFRLAVKVVPRSSRSEIAGWMGDVLRVRVTAPAERGKANAAVEKLLAQVLGLPGSAVRIVSGGSSPRKTVEITGLSEAEAEARFGEVPALFH